MCSSHQAGQRDGDGKKLNRFHTFASNIFWAFCNFKAFFLNGVDKYIYSKKRRSAATVALVLYCVQDTYIFSRSGQHGPVRDTKYVLPRLFLF